jgi:ribosomal protein S12 methylthiotransferase accessory factor
MENGLTFSFAAGHNFALMSRDLRFVLQNLRGRSGGKGVTEAQAKVSAICEAIERYSGVYQPGGIVERVDAFEDIAADAIHPNELMRFSDAQYDDRSAWNERHLSGFHKVPERFDPARRIHWTPSWSLTNERFVWVPSPYAYFGHPELHDWFYCTSDSNGNAAGNTLEEAILQGFFELVERDAAAVWWYNRIQRPAVDLDSFEEPYIDALREHYARQQREFWVLDLTHDFGVPTFAAVSRRLDHPVEDLVVGFGAHLEPRIALLRAITEINQFMPAVENRDAQGNTIYWFPEPEAVQWFKTATLEANRFLLPAPLPPRRAGDFTTKCSNDIADDVRTCVGLARDRGMEMLVVDQTQPDIGVGVAKVMVPGMRHFWKRFGPGRLYDVPVRLGWLDAPLREEQLNPVGVFF